jgi:hypothetical protein
MEGHRGDLARPGLSAELVGPSEAALSLRELAWLPKEAVSAIDDEVEVSPGRAQVPLPLDLSRLVPKERFGHDPRQVECSDASLGLRWPEMQPVL